MNKYLQRLNDVIQVEATTSSIADFLVTHKPFKNLYSFVQNEELSSNAIDEEVLYDNIFHKEINNHQFVVIQGTQGCGKSHLIRWMKVRLEEEIDKNKEAVMFISRNHNTLQDAIKQILDSDIFPDEIKNNQIKRLKENSSNGYTGEELKKQIIFNLKLEIDYDLEHNINDILDRRMKDMLKTFIMDENIQKKFLLTTNSPIEKIRSKIESTDNSVNFDESPVFSKDDFKMSTAELISPEFRDSHVHTKRFAEKLNSDYEADKNKENVARYLNSKVSKVIERSEKFKTTDLKELFNSLRVELKKEGKNLVLFIEDLTAFTGLDKAIVEVLIANHKAEGNEEYCRIISVVGLTRAFYEDNIPDHLRDRITTNVLINTSSNSANKETFFKNKDEIADFAARYMNAINLEENIIKEWVKQGADYNQLPIFSDNLIYKWANVEVGEQTMSIYPFNKNALWNLYFSISETKRTPRAFLKDVLKYLLTIWSSNTKNFLHDEKIFDNGIIRIPNWSNVKNYEQDNDSYNAEDIIPRKLLLCIWGNQTTEKYNDKVGDVEKEIFEHFNVSTDIFEKLNSTNVEQSVVKQTQQTSQSVVSNNTQIVIDKNYDKLYSEINEWNSKPNGQLPSHIELRELLVKSIINTLDWFKYDVPRQLVEKFSQKNIKIQGQVLDSGSKYLFNVGNNTETKYMLIALIGFKYKGKNSWDYENSTDDYINFVTWLKHYEKDIVKFVLAQNGEIFDNALYNVMAEYYLKAFLGMIKSNYSTIDIVKSLIKEPEDKTLQFNSNSVFWNDTYSYIKKNYMPTMMHSVCMNYFMRLFGEESTETVKYKLYDISLLLDKLDIIQNKKFNIDSFQIDRISDESLLAYLKPISFLKFINAKQQKLVEDSKSTLQIESIGLMSALSEDINSDEIKEVLEEMEKFLHYLQNELNIPYPSDKFRDLINGNISSNAIYGILKKKENIEKEDNILSSIELIADFNFELLQKVNRLFMDYADFLKTEKNLYSSTHEGDEAKKLSEYKDTIKNSIKTMLKTVEEEY